MKISKILAGMSAAAIVASMAMIPASAAACEFTVSDDLVKIGRPATDGSLFAVFFNGDESEGPVNKGAIDDLSKVYGASFTIKVDDNDWNTIGGGGSVNFNDTASGWVAFDWAGGSWVDDEKPTKSLVYTTDEAGTYVVEYLGDTALFTTEDGGDEAYAAVGINNWAGDLKGIDIVGMKVLGSDGSALFEAGSNKDKKEIQKKPVADESTSGTDSTASGTDSKADSKADSKTDSKTSSAAATSTAATSSKSGTTTTTATSSAAASDNTAATGATAGLALAGVALAGAAIVISKRK